MNDEEYNQIIKNIDQENNYKINDGILYKVKDNQLLRVIRRYEIEGIMYMFHDHPISAHFATQTTYDKIKERYFGKEC